MRASLPSRFITIDGAHGGDAVALLAEMRCWADDRVAVEIVSAGTTIARWAMEAAVGLGLEVAARLRDPAALDGACVAQLRAHGCGTIVIGIDGHDAATHDAYHGTPNAFASALRALELARHLGFDTYVLSRVHGSGARHLERMSMLSRWAGAKAWFVSFAGAPGGQGAATALSVPERRQACAWLHDIAQRNRQAIAVRCQECGTHAWLSSEACIDPAEIAATPCPQGQPASVESAEADEAFAGAGW